MTKKAGTKEDIGSKLAALAIIIADKASKPDVLLTDVLDAFKALTAYHIGTTRVNAKRDTEDDDEGSTFNGLRKRIDAAASSGNGSGDTRDDSDTDLFN